MPMYTADGVPECLKAVRMQLRAGAKLIKIAASGGVATELVCTPSILFLADIRSFN